MGEELVILALEGILELLAQLLIYLPWDILLWMREEKRGEEKGGAACAIVTAIVLGGVLGGVSLLVWRETALSSPALRIGNLLVAPLLCGWLGARIAKLREARGATSSAALHFWFAWTFTFAMVLVRFVWAVRPEI